MKLSRLRIENFRSFEDETINFDDYTCFVGRNGAGKSTILTALNIFFRETADAATDLLRLCEEDFHAGDTTKPVCITATFVGLEDEAKKDFAAYYRAGELSISTVAEWQASVAEVKQFGDRLGMEDFRKYFEQDKAGEKVDVLKKTYQDLKAKYTGLPDEKVKAQMAGALQAYEAAHPEECIQIPSEDEFYGVSRGVNRLEKYLQWVYIPAVKDATAEQEQAKTSALSRLLQRRVYSQLKLDGRISEIKVEASAKYTELLNEHQEPLDQVSESLNKRFQRWAHPNASVNLSWAQASNVISITSPVAEMKAKEGAFTGDLARFGHGLQRSFIFALLEELAEHSATGPLLILGCEEPELYQHPPQARYMASVLERLSKDHAQVCVCTHSPCFVSGRGFEAIRAVQKGATGAAAVKQSSFDRVAQILSAADGKPPIRVGGMEAKIQQEMQGQMNELFFAQVPVLVEGLEDIAFITTYMELLGSMDEFRSLGGHIVQCQGKNHLIQAVAICNSLSLPCFVVFDADGDTEPDTPQKQTGKRQQHERENATLMKLMGVTVAAPFPKNIYSDTALTVWPTKIGDIVRGEVGLEQWGKCEDNVRKEHANYSGDMGKNSLFIAYVVLEAWKAKSHSISMEALCERIITHARSSASSGEPLTIFAEAEPVLIALISSD
jgi:putative ATP-dependent endonuclease of the OLD family